MRSARRLRRAREPRRPIHVLSTPNRLTAEQAMQLKAQWLEAMKRSPRLLILDQGTTVREIPAPRPVTQPRPHRAGWPRRLRGMGLPMAPARRP